MMKRKGLIIALLVALAVAVCSMIFERILLYLPSVLLIVVLLFASKLFSEFLFRKYVDRNDITDNREWWEYARKNFIKIFLASSAPKVILIAPLIEEAIFRLPLLMMFSSVTTFAWLAIILSAMLFSMGHWNTGILHFHEFISFIDNQVDVEDLGKMPELVKEHAVKNPSVNKRRVFILTITFFLGVYSGYCGIKYQSIWICIFIHFLFNTLALLVQFPFQILAVRRLNA